MNQKFAKIVDEKRDLTMAFDGKSLNLSAMADKDSFYSRNEIGYFFNGDEEEEYINQFNSRYFTLFKNQTSAILGVRYYNLKYLVF